MLQHFALMQDDILLVMLLLMMLIARMFVVNACNP